jgi:hypothetical protein
MPTKSRFPNKLAERPQNPAVRFEPARTPKIQRDEGRDFPFWPFNGTSFAPKSAI